MRTRSNNSGMSVYTTSMRRTLQTCTCAHLIHVPPSTYMLHDGNVQHCQIIVCESYSRMMARIGMHVGVLMIAGFVGSIALLRFAHCNTKQNGWVCLGLKSCGGRAGWQRCCRRGVMMIIGSHCNQMCCISLHCFPEVAVNTSHTSNAATLLYIHDDGAAIQLQIRAVVALCGQPCRLR